MTTIQALPPTLTVADLRTSSRRRRVEATMRTVFFSAAVASIVISALIIFSLAAETWEFLDGLRQADQLGSLWGGIGWFPRRDLYDLRTLLVGSFLVTAVAMLIAFPLGLGAAIYLAEYANPRVRRLLKPVIEVLAGIPSVVLGFFALTVISPGVVQRAFAEAPQFTVLAAGIGVGILVVPLVASIAEDALRSVPNSLREASAGVGARPMTTTLRVVVPAAISGLVAAAIVGMSRAIGETMVVAIAAGATGGGTFSLNVLEPGQTMTAAMAALAIGSDQVAGSSLAFQSLFLVGSILFFITLLLNAIAERFVARVRHKY
jgi:phosphate transport system permease protein